MTAKPLVLAAQTPLPMDSVEVSMLTCSPHEEIYSLYGHTALRFHDLRPGGVDVAFNYGVFDFHKPHFILRFTLGLTDYELGVYPYRLFEQEYRKFGSEVVEQVINLTDEEKNQLYLLLSDNLQEGNRVYRYNFLYNNCSTKVRDILEKCLHGRLQYAERQDYKPSFRELVHEMTRHHPWATFGNDLLLGVGADRPTNRSEQEFLPHNMMYDFDHAQILGDDGQYRPLVKERRIAVPAGVQVIEQDFPLTPTQCGILLMAVSLVVLLVEMKRKCVFRLWDVSLMLLTGIAGLLIVFMFFSQHPTTSTNLQVFLLNPLPLFFIPSVWRRRTTRWWAISLVLIGLFLIGGFWQTYAEGMYFVALSLLIRYGRNITYKHAK